MADCVVDRFQDEYGTIIVFTDPEARDAWRKHVNPGTDYGDSDEGPWLRV